MDPMDPIFQYGTLVVYTFLLEPNNERPMRKVLYRNSMVRNKDRAEELFREFADTNKNHINKKSLRADWIPDTESLSLNK